MLFAGSTALAQSRNLRGIVTDTAMRPLQNVEVRIMDLGRMTRTDSLGRFAIPRITARMVDLSLRRLGYQVYFVRVSMLNGDGDSVRIRMTQEPVLLTQVDISGIGEARHPFFIGFEQRRAIGMGTFITEQQISSLNTSYPSDALRRVPGIRFVRVGGGHGVRFTSAIGSLRRGGECVPTIFVDGQAAPGLEIDEIRAGDIHGIEIYRGASTTPSQFVRAGAAQCGAIVVWTRRNR
ncbi:MAG: carboxypeptidase regulatory-like domain-containing protein [Gemmatimonadaceae bacterium]